MRFAPLALLLAFAGRSEAATGVLPPSSVQLEKAYRRAPSLDLLYELGRSARAEGRVLAAIDLFRRYLDEAGDRVDPPRRQEIAALIASPRPPTGEIYVGGDPGAFLSVDDRLAGALPLALPLLVEPGVHKLRLDKGPRQVEEQVSVPAGRMRSVRFSLSPPMTFSNLTPAVVLSHDLPGGEAGLAARLEQAVRVSLAKAPAVLVKRGSEDAQFSLHLTVRAAGKDVEVHADLQDLATGTIGASGAAACTACSEVALAQRLTPLMAQLILDALTRPRGRLQVASMVGGAVVIVDGRRIGAIPSEKEAFAGPHVVRVERAGYLPFEERVMVTADQTTRLEARLVRLPPPPARPLRAAGAVLIAGGLAGVIAGGVLLGLGGSGYDCWDQHPDICTMQLDPTLSGLSSFIPAGVGLITGTVLLGLDARHQRERRHQAAPGWSTGARE